MKRHFPKFLRDDLRSFHLWQKEKWQKCKTHCFRSILFCSRELAFNKSSCGLHNIRITSLLPTESKPPKLWYVHEKPAAHRLIDNEAYNGHALVLVLFSCVARIQIFSCESYRHVIAAVLSDTHSQWALPCAPHSKNTDNLQCTEENNETGSDSIIAPPRAHLPAHLAWILRWS